MKTYFRIFYFYEPVDRIISELKCRFDEGPHEIITNMAEILFDKKVSCETFRSVCEFYSLDLDGLKADHELFQHFKDRVEKYEYTAAEMYKMLVNKHMVMMLPELSKLMKIFAVLPISSCEAERSFSTLRRLKTYLRSNMGQNRLSSLALMNIERTIVNIVIKEQMKQMIDTFGRRKNRNSYFF